jgi:hypothetical protein
MWRSITLDDLIDTLHGFPEMQPEYVDILVSMTQEIHDVKGIMGGGKFGGRPETKITFTAVQSGMTRESLLCGDRCPADLGFGCRKTPEEARAIYRELVTNHGFILTNVTTSA